MLRSKFDKKIGHDLILSCLSVLHVTHSHYSLCIEDRDDFQTAITFEIFML